MLAAQVQAAPAEGVDVLGGGPDGGGDPPVIAYAHCARRGGGVTVAVINYKNATAAVDIACPGLTPQSARDDYVLTAAAAPIEQGVKLNGATLRTAGDIKPSPGTGTVVVLPSLSISFLNFKTDSGQCAGDAE